MWALPYWKQWFWDILTSLKSSPVTGWKPWSFCSSPRISMSAVSWISLGVSSMLFFPKWSNRWPLLWFCGVCISRLLTVLWELYPELCISIGAIGPKVDFLYSLLITDPTLLLKLSTGHAYPLEDRFRARLPQEYFPALSFVRVIIASRSPGSVNQKQLWGVLPDLV